MYVRRKCRLEKQVSSISSYSDRIVGDFNFLFLWLFIVSKLPRVNMISFTIKKKTTQGIIKEVREKRPSLISDEGLQWCFIRNYLPASWISFCKLTLFSLAWHFWYNLCVYRLKRPGSPLRSEGIQQVLHCTAGPQHLAPSRRLPGSHKAPSLG